MLAHKIKYIIFIKYSKNFALHNVTWVMKSLVLVHWIMKQVKKYLQVSAYQ